MVRLVIKIYYDNTVEILLNGEKAKNDNNVYLALKLLEAGIHNGLELQPIESGDGMIVLLATSD